MKTACIVFGCGCPRMMMDTARLFRYFDLNGYNLVDSSNDADFVLLTTCGVNRKQEKISIKRLSIVNANRKRSSKLLVLGCLADINESQILGEFNAVPVPPLRMGELDRIIGARVKFREIEPINHIEPYIAMASKNFITANQKGNILHVLVGLKKIRELVREMLILLGFRRFLMLLGLKKIIFLIPSHAMKFFPYL